MKNIKLKDLLIENKELKNFLAFISVVSGNKLRIFKKTNISYTKDVAGLIIMKRDFGVKQDEVAVWIDVHGKQYVAIVKSNPYFKQITDKAKELGIPIQ